MNETIRSIIDRRSNRGFSQEPFYPGQVELLEECATASPTAMNLQSWHFTFVTDKDIIAKVERETIDALYGDSDESVKQRIRERGETIFYGAPLVVFISADKNNKWSQIDAGIAVENLAVAAQSMGLGSVIIGLCGKAFEGSAASELEKLLGFPENHSFAISIAIGKPTATKDAHPVLEDRVTRL